jgi:hypothetical protein
MPPDAATAAAAPGESAASAVSVTPAVHAGAAGWCRSASISAACWLPGWLPTAPPPVSTSATEVVGSTPCCICCAPVWMAVPSKPATPEAAASVAGSVSAADGAGVDPGGAGVVAAAG